MGRRNQLRGRFVLALDFAAQQLRHLVTAYPDYFPTYTTNGTWQHAGGLWVN